MSVNKVSSSLSAVVCCPCNLISSTLSCLAQKVKNLIGSLIGFLVSTFVFMFGNYNNRVKRMLIEWQKSGPYDTRQRAPFDPHRLDRSIQILKDLGASRYKLPSLDGAAQIDTMLVRREDVKKKIESHGGEWKEVRVKASSSGFTVDPQGDLTLEVIYDPLHPYSSPNWLHFSKHVLSKMGWKSTPLTLGDGQIVPAFITAKWEKDQVRLPKKHCSLFFHSPTESYAMDKITIGNYLEMGDVCVFDPRGYYQSSPQQPTEGSVYVDGETVYRDLLKKGYRPEEIVISGFCLGGAEAAKLKVDHPQSPLITINSFESIEATLRNQVWPASCLAPLGIPSLQTKDKAITKLTTQDGFNTEAKLRSIKPDPTNGPCIIIHHKDDKTVSPQAHDKLVAAAEKGCKTFGLTCHVQQEGKSGHSTDPFHDPKMLKSVIKILATGSL